MLIAPISQWICFASIIAFLLFSLPAQLTAVNTDESLTQYGIFVIGFAFFIEAFLLTQKNTYRKFVEYFIYAFILYVLLLCFKSFHMYFILKIDRPTAGVGNPITFAQLLELTIPILVSLTICKSTSFVKRLGFTIIIIVMTSGLIISQTRGAWLALFITISLILLLEKAYKATIIGCGILGVLSLLQYKQIMQRASTFTSLAARTNAERIYCWSVTPDIIANYPMGVGFRHFNYTYAEFMLEEAKMVLPHAHNSFFGLATEAGIFAAVSFFIFLGIIIYKVFRNINVISNQYHRSLALGCIFGICSILLHGLVDYPVRKFNVLLLLMLEAGFAYGLANYYEKLKYGR